MWYVWTGRQGKLSSLHHRQRTNSGSPRSYTYRAPPVQPKLILYPFQSSHIAVGLPPASDDLWCCGGLALPFGHTPGCVLGIRFFLSLLLLD
jgi:hypothetical protein